MGADAINVKGAQLWNNLKIDIKPTVSNKVFKKAFKDSILIYKPWFYDRFLYDTNYTLYVLIYVRLFYLFLFDLSFR